MKEIKHISKLVKTLLISDPKTRNSDNYLYYRILKMQGEKKGIDIEKMPLTTFLMKMSEYGFAPFETVRRTRQKLQEHNPELAAVEEVAEYRAEKEVEFREYVKMGVH